MLIMSGSVPLLPSVLSCRAQGRVFSDCFCASCSAMLVCAVCVIELVIMHHLVSVIQFISDTCYVTEKPFQFS